MKFIAWDTSSKSGAIVAFEGTALGVSHSPRLITELTLNVDLTHSERLLWGIHQVLESARWDITEVDGFGVGVGPGSFTGLRVGLTTARTLAHTLNKPLVGVSSLAALARPVALHFAQKEWPFQTHVIAVTDACKGELFCLEGKAKDIASPMWKNESTEKVISPQDLMKDLKKKLTSAKSRWIAVGEGRERYLDMWDLLPKKKELQIPSLYSNQVQGRYLGQLVWEAMQEHNSAELTQSPLSVHPQYLRASDAELKLKAGLLKRAPVSE